MNRHLLNQKLLYAMGHITNDKFDEMCLLDFTRVFVNLLLLDQFLIILILHHHFKFSFLKHLIQCFIENLRLLVDHIYALVQNHSLHNPIA